MFLLQLSNLAALGCKVHACLAAGQPVEDGTIIQVLVEELRYGT